MRLGLQLFLGVLLLSACSVYDPKLVGEDAGDGSGSAGRRSTGESVGAVEISDHCDEADGTCSREHANAICIEGACLIANCMPPFVDCDQAADNGCEADLTSVEHCALCGAACRFSHASGSCDDGSCNLAACDDHYDDCDHDPGNGCERSLNSTSDCGACGRRCSKPAHGSATCDDGRCGVRCESGFGDCDGDADNGCEQALDQTDHCGACGTNCTGGAHVSAGACMSGQCVVMACEPGFENCNSDPKDGCEAGLASVTHCGGCGNKCDLSNVRAQRCVQNDGKSECGIERGCKDGDTSCTMDLARGCAADYADCNADEADGCETDLRQLATCGACKVSCLAEHAITECRDGGCVTTSCAQGYDRCGGSEVCKSLLGDAANCGECGRTCAATERCTAGKCSALTCDAGRGDCDSNAMNGCETGLNEVQHCGGCDVNCATLANTTQTSCTAGSCAITTCKDGFADCDKDVKNGCETALDTDKNCGGCGVTCARPQAQMQCQDRSCKLVRCNDQRADCNNDLNKDGCETDLTTPDHCGSCANVCNGPNAVASTCNAGAACVVNCTAGFANCNGNAADGCEASLDSGTTCGSCGMNCGALPHVASASCASGACRSLVCAGGFADCDGDATNGCERAINTLSDCGACDRPCSFAHATAECSTGTCKQASCDSGYDSCGDDPTCTSLATSDHCGSCDKRCRNNESCVNGKCVECDENKRCGNGDECCNGQCVNTKGRCSDNFCLLPSFEDLDTNNCGACGKVCRYCCAGPL